MRALLVNPTLQGETFNQHLGITSVASYLNARTDHRAGIIDFAFHRKNWRKYLRKKIDEQCPDVFGITLSSPNFYAVKEVVEELRRYGRPIICGGPGATIMPGETMASLPIDALCRGEGEITMAEYLDSMENDNAKTDIPGLWIRQGDTVIKNPLRPVIRDLNTLPFLDWTLWEDIERMLSTYRILSFIGVRGCPHECTYCSATVLRETLPGFVRECSPRYYVEHIKYQWEKLKDYGMTVAWLWDQVFTANPEWLEEFVNEYIRQRVSDLLPYAVYARADELDEHRVELLKKSGCITVRIGFETGDRYMRYEVYKKPISDESYFKAVQLCRRYQLPITGYFMLGGPGETYSSLKNTYNLVRKLKVDIPTFYVYKPLPKTEAVSKLKEFGGKIDNLWDWKVVDIRFGGMVHTPFLSPRQVERFQWKCILRFIPWIIIKQMLKWRLTYFLRLFQYLSRNIGKGTPFIDLLRNFTYSFHILMASTNPQNLVKTVKDKRNNVQSIAG